MNKNKFKKGFTLIELVICIAVISIMAAVLIPTFVNTYKDVKTDVVELYNNPTVICYLDNIIIYQGKANEIPTDFKELYVLDKVDYSDGIVYMYYKIKRELT